MKLIIFHSTHNVIKDLIPITSSENSDPTSTIDEIRSNIFVDILYETLSNTEYYRFFEKQIPLGLMDVNHLKLLAKQYSLPRYCFIPTKTLFTPERLEEIIRLKNIPHPSIRCDVIILSEYLSNYIKLHYYLVWNPTSNSVEAIIELIISSKEYLENKLEKYKVGEELISRLLYTKNRYKTVKAITNE